MQCMIISDNVLTYYRLNRDSRTFLQQYAVELERLYENAQRVNALLTQHFIDNLTRL